jgi:hypothetical protein
MFVLFVYICRMLRGVIKYRYFRTNIGCVALCSPVSLSIDRGLNTSDSSFADYIERKIKLDKRDENNFTELFENAQALLESNLTGKHDESQLIVIEALP